jgi:ABC-2 type transport system ATP-binding protein
VVLDQGEVVATDTPEGLLGRVSGDVIVMEAQNPQKLVTEIHEALGLEAHVHEGLVLLEREAGHTWVPRLVEALPAGRLQALSLRRPTLADAFFRLTGQALTRPQESV